MSQSAACRVGVPDTSSPPPSPEMEMRKKYCRRAVGPERKVPPPFFSPPLPFLATVVFNLLTRGEKVSVPWKEKISPFPSSHHTSLFGYGGTRWMNRYAVPLPLPFPPPPPFFSLVFSRSANQRLGGPQLQECLWPSSGVVYKFNRVAFPLGQKLILRGPPPPSLFFSTCQGPR